MSESLLAYFNRELEALRGLAGEFAERHPKIAGRLRLTKDTVDDPHVGRLLEGVAFLGARVQHRLDDEFPELTDGLLSVLYPHYLAPMPSVAITRFAADPGMPGPAQLPAGLAIETEPVGGEACQFRTAYPLTLWPVEIDAVRLSGMPLPAPPNPAAAGAVSCLRISLRCANPAMTFTQLGLDRLRFFLGGERGSALLELLLAHTLSVALADDQADARPVILPPDALQAVGFAPEEALFPWPARSFSGFRLLSEYFSAREKFLFIDFCRLDAKTLVSAGNRMDIFVYLDRALPELERSVQASSLALGCTPIVNLFEQRCEPIALDHTRIEYRIEPDVRRPGKPRDLVRRTRARKPAGRRVPAWEPFHRLTRSHAGETRERRRRRLLRHGPPRDHGRHARHRSLPAATRCGLRSRSGERRRPVDRRAVLQPRSARRAAVRRRPSGASARGRGRCRHRSYLPDRADADPAHAFAGAWILAADLPSVARPSERRRRRGGGRGFARGAAAL